MQKRRQIIKDVFKLTSSRYISQFAGFFTSIIMRRALGPFYIGIWSLLRIISDYTYYLMLGVNDAICYKVPILSGQGKELEIDNVKDVAFNFIFAVGCLTSLAVLIAAIILHNRYPVEVIVGLLAVSIYVLVDRICGYYMILLRARKNFSVLSKSIIFDAIMNLCLVTLVVRNFKIYGLYATVIILTMLNTMFIHSLVRYRIRLNFKFDGIAELIKFGLPMTILQLLQGAPPVINTVMVAKMIGVVFVGYYSVSIMTKNYITQLSSFGTVLYPWILESFGKKESIKDIEKYVIIPPKINAYILPLLLGWVFFVAPIFIKIVLPKFVPGILVIQILLFDMFFSGCSSQAVHFLFALKKQVRIIPIVAFAIFLAATLNYAAIKRGYGIYGVAFSASIVSFATFSLQQIYAMRHFAKAKEILLFFIEILTPLLYTGIAVLLINNFVKLQNVYIEVAIRCFILLVFSAPLLIHIDRQTRVITTVISVVKEAIFRKKAVS